MTVPWKGHLQEKFAGDLHLRGRSPCHKIRPGPQYCARRVRNSKRLIRGSLWVVLSVEPSSKGVDNAELSSSRRQRSDRQNNLPPSSSKRKAQLKNPHANTRAREALAKAKLSSRFRRFSGDAAAPFRTRPVDAAAASSVLRGTATTGACNETLEYKGKALMQKFTEPRAGAFENIRESVDTNLNLSSVGKEHEVSNAGAEVTEWDSFVDWKIMEHQDYETIPDDQFQVLSKKLHIKESWRPVVSYLISLGLHTKELEKVLVECEELFKRPIAKIVTRVEYLQSELGFDSAELRKLIDKEPTVLLQQNRHSVPRCRYLTQLGIPAESLPKVIRKQPQILQLSVSKGLGPRVDFFEKQLRIPEAEIPKLIERNPAVLTLSIENQIKPRLEYFKMLGIPDDGLVKMIVRHPHLLHYSFEGLEEHINFLASIGMTEQEMVHTVTRLSQIFSLSVANSLKPKFIYLTEELGGNVQTCVKFPAYFSLSLDKRIRPRHTYLQQLDISPDPFPMRYLSEKDEDFAARTSRSLQDYISFKVRSFYGCDCLCRIKD